MIALVIVIRFCYYKYLVIDSSMTTKFNWAAAKAAKAAGPRAPGSKTVPEPESPDCLLGLSFVFTGELSSFSRDEAIDLAKRYGGYAGHNHRVLS